MEKSVFYPFRSNGDLEELSVVLDQQSAGGTLSVGLLSQGTFTGRYHDVTVPVPGMPFCQAAIVHDSQRFGRDLPRVLEENGLGKVVGESQRPGSRGCAVFQFDPEVLRGLDPQVFAEYERACQFQQHSPIGFERQNIRGIEWRVAVHDVGGDRVPIAACALGDSQAPVIVTPENDSYVVFAQGQSPQSCPSMDEAIDRAAEMIRDLPEQERNAYLAHPEGREGIYQMQGEEYCVNAFLSQDYPGYVTLQFLESDGLMVENSIYKDDLPFDEEVSAPFVKDGYLSIEECVRDVAAQFMDSDDPDVRFIAPCDHAIETVGEYREAVKGANGRDISLDDLMKAAKEKAAERGMSATKNTKGRHDPDMGL